MDKISIKGVLIGAISAYVVGIVLIAVLMLWMVITLDMQHLPAAQRYQAAHALPLGSLLRLTEALSAIIGGYVAARTAQHHEILNGALSSFYPVCAGLYTILFGHYQSPLWQMILHIPLTIAFAALGGYLRLRQVRAKQAQA